MVLQRPSLRTSMFRHQSTLPLPLSTTTFIVPTTQLKPSRTTPPLPNGLKLKRQAAFGMNQCKYRLRSLFCANQLIPCRPAGASGVGMNIAQGTNLAPGSLASVVSDMWYNGEILNFPGYGQANLDTSSAAFQGWGHFSQVVWSTTESIGCGTSQCGPGTSIGSGYFTACLYYPPGKTHR